VFFLTCKDRELLYSKIEGRVDQMLDTGLLEEAKTLYEKGMLNENFTSYGAIGYKEFIPYFNGECLLNDCVERLKISTRQYAKRQLTWFARKAKYHKIYVDEQDAFEYIKNFFDKCEDN
jgi:tRNA dimethylallyltransferase